MTDKELMTTILNEVKTLSKLLIDATIESSHKNINETMKESLNSALDLQNIVYNVMKKKGWYKLENTTEDKIKKVIQKFKTKTA